MTPEQKRLILLQQAAARKEKPKKDEKDLNLDMAGFAFIACILLIILFAWFAGQVA
jgi:hypothetical protein